MPNRIEIEIAAEEFRKKLNIKDGKDGAVGPVGPIGKDGKQGLKGVAGKKGVEGKRGPKGPKGDEGEQGTDGSPDTPIEIVEKINTLPLTSPHKIDASHIKNLPIVVTGGNERRPFIKTVTDTASVDLAVSNGDLTATVLPAGVDHGTLGGLADDDHTQYALLAGRAGGQTLIGGTASGDNLTLQSTSHATKGKILFGASGTSLFDEVNTRLEIFGFTAGFPATSGSTQTGLGLRLEATGTNEVLDIGSRGGALGSWLQGTNKTALNNNYPFFLNPNGGNVGIGMTSSSARLHLPAGTATASTAPLKFTSGTNLTAAEAGAIEFDGTALTYTTSTPTRIRLLGHNLGISGGTILIGGTGTTDDLILRTTSGIGATGADMIFQVGNNGATEAMTIQNDGSILMGTATAPIATHLISMKSTSTNVFINVSSSAQGAAIGAGHDDGSTEVTGNVLGRLDFWGRKADGNLTNSTAIRGFAEANWSAIQLGAYLSFLTTTGTSSTEKMRITGKGIVVIGTNFTLAGNFDAATVPLQVRGTTPTATIEDTGASGAGGGGNFYLLSNDGAGPVDGDRLGLIAFGGNSGAGGNLTASSYILGYAAGTWNGTARGSYMNFFTTPSGQSSGATRFTLSDNGDVFIGNGRTVAAPSAGILQATGGLGTNIAGANLTLAGGRATGNAAGGDIIFQTSDVLGSGSTLQSLTTKLTITELGAVILAGRLQGDKGADVASGADITLGTDGNYFDITGTTTINTISATNWQAGSIVVLQFDGSVTVAHNTAGAGASILLAGAANFAATANDTLQLAYDGSTWREISRTAI